IMQWFCWHVAGKMSLGFLCLFLVFHTGKDYSLSCLVSQQEKLFLSLFLHLTASCIGRENKKEKQVAVLATAELPANSVDLAAVNLTELVNGMLNTALRGTKKLFSLLSITSYSSFAFHKVSVTIYNTSNMKNVDPGKFPMHYCYCLNNVTNDLTDFTALLVDIIGNSTSYLTEIFKSTSILSVRQSNDSDCIYICVMTGQTGRNLSIFWEKLEKTPVINYTFSSNKSSDLNLDSIFSSFMKSQEDPNKTVDPSAEHVWTFKNGIFLGAFFILLSPSVLHLLLLLGTSIPSVFPVPSPDSPASAATRIPLAQKGEEIPTMRFLPWPKTVAAKGSGFPSPPVDASRPRSTAEPPLTAGGSSAPKAAKIKRNGAPSCASLTNYAWYLCRASDTQPVYRGTHGTWELQVSARCSSMTPATSELHFFLGCPQAILKESRVTSPPVTLIVQKINPCVMELCRFFQLCLCVGQRYSRKEAMRYCVEYYSWFLKNASYICERVKTVAYSRTLKQKCLKNICTLV
ncbi:HHLA1 protein, partial [Pandion haliaetus]|nr:HHLA1 protein [Pandion haliaetus]